MPKQPPVAAHRELTAPELSLMWAVPRDAVVGWIKSGALKTSPRQFAVTTAEAQQFVDSAEGRALINAARAEGLPSEV